MNRQYNKRKLKERQKIKRYMKEEKFKNTELKSFFQEIKKIDLAKQEQ